jgi:hypothetical protein
MMTTFALIAMQILISAEAGFVNFVQGTASVSVHQQVPVGTPIETQARSHVELLLTPGTVLRIGQNSSIVLDSVDLSNVVVRVNSGEAIVESSNLDKKMPIHVKSGSLDTLIAEPGLYRFSGDTATVFEGKLQAADHSATAKKGAQITAVAGKDQVTPMSASFRYDDLDAWSSQRSNILSQANTLALYGNSTGSYFPYSMAPVVGYASYGTGWIYSPFVNGFTFVPSYGYQSYYGYYYYSGPAFSQGVYPVAATGMVGRNILTRPERYAAPGGRQSINMRPGTGQVSRPASSQVSRPVAARPAGAPARSAVGRPSGRP